MTRRALTLVAAAAALTAAAAVVVVALAAGSGEPGVAPPGGDPVLLQASIEPEQALFGDRLDATLTVTIDSTRVDPDTVEVATFFRPFRRVGPIERERTELGETVVLAYRAPIQCVDRGCLVTEASQGIELPVGVVRYASRQGPVGSLPVTWPAVSLATRLSPGQVDALRTSPQDVALDDEARNLPPVSYAIGPSVLGWLLVGAGAFVVLALGGWLAWRLRRPAREAVEPEASPAEQTPLAAALAAVERALAQEDVAARRTALDALSLELGRRDQPAPALEARRLAWSRAVPDEAGARALLVQLRDAA